MSISPSFIPIFFRPFYASSIFFVEKYGVICYINVIDGDDKYIQFANFAVFQGIFICGGFLITLFSYILTITRIRKIKIKILENEDLKTNRLLLYPAVLFFALLPPTITQILRIVKDWDGLSAAFIMTITHSLGFLNALIYGCLRKVHKGPRENAEKLIEFRSDSLRTLRWNEVRDFMEY